MTPLYSIMETRIKNNKIKKIAWVVEKWCEVWGHDKGGIWITVVSRGLYTNEVVVGIVVLCSGVKSQGGG